MENRSEATGGGIHPVKIYFGTSIEDVSSRITTKSKVMKAKLFLIAAVTALFTLTANLCSAQGRYGHGGGNYHYGGGHHGGGEHFEGGDGCLEAGCLGAGCFGLGLLFNPVAAPQSHRVWIEGHWGYDQYGTQVWYPGHYEWMN